MKEKKNIIKTKKQMFIVIGAFILTLLLGTTTYAFFNYTRTGSQNIIKTGRIYFNSEQGTAMNLDNLFPIDPTATGIMNDNTKVGTVTINVVGDTTYGGGIEYLVSAVNVTNTIGSGQNAKELPISIQVSVESNTGNNPATTLGTEDEDYFADRGSETSYYKVLAGDTISEDSELLVGYIARGATGVDGNIIIKAYIDENKVAITDTYPEGVVYTVNENFDSSDCETVLTGVQDAETYCATASSLQDAIEGEELEEEQIALLVNAGMVTEYTDGTTSTWVNNRTVFTTSEWNSLQTNGISFQVKVEANEGTWVSAPSIASFISNLPGLENVAGAKRYVGANVDNYVIFNNEQWRIIGVYNDAINGDMVKIIRASVLDNSQVYNTVDAGNVWVGSFLHQYLNTEYFDSLSTEAQGMISNGTWNAGACGAKINAASAYTCSQASTWTGKVGLLASYEYQYASESSCYETNGYSYYYNNGAGCSATNWLYRSVIEKRWLITPDTYTNSALTILDGSSGGYVNYDNVVSVPNRVQPVVYLKPEVGIAGGTGALGDEYILAYTRS